MNEVGSGLMIKDTLQGVPVDISASLIMNLVSDSVTCGCPAVLTHEQLFGFGADNYYRDVLILFAFIVGFAVMVIFVVWFKVRERR